MGAIDEAEGEEEGDGDADDELAAFDAMRLGTDVVPCSPHAWLYYLGCCAASTVNTYHGRTLRTLRSRCEAASH